MGESKQLDCRRLACPQPVLRVKEALEQGAVGDFIRVRNLDTRHIVEGVVTAPGRVEILQKGDGGT